jgi:hypothetical protein
MTENVEVVYLEPPESARYVNVSPSSSARYVVYTSTTTVLPSSYDQILKNHVLLAGGRIEDLQPFGAAPSAESAA